MNPNLTEIAYILDRSGSMEPLKEAAIAGFNEFLRQQMDVPGNVRLTLVLFDDEYLVPVAALPLQEVPELNARTYVPRGSTALLDAIGETVDTLGQRLTAIPEPRSPAKVIVVIFTDGLENASHRYKWHDISSRIRHQRSKYQWDFIFLAANQDAIATASKLNIGREYTSDMKSTAAGISGSKAGLSRKVRAMRCLSQGIHTADMDASMSDLVVEETRAAESNLHSTPKPPQHESGKGPRTPREPSGCDSRS